jgi:6-pyruvoyltetrahydropterin 2'-reductase
MAVAIAEIFGDGILQGEGTRMGVPSVFIRLGGCNLTCKGFGCTLTSPKTQETIIGCDSIFAVSTHFKQQWEYFDKSTDLINVILSNINVNNKPGNSEKPDIVFTGGEPLIHHTDPVLLETLEYFTSRGYTIYFETNGTQYIDFNKYDVYKKVSFTLSVKMSASGEDKNKRWKPEVVNNYLKYTNGSYFKFVLSANSIEQDSKEIFEFLEQVPTFGVVYCMPLGGTIKELESNAKAVYEFAANNGFRYSDRLHIRIYNDLQGV